MYYAIHQETKRHFEVDPVSEEWDGPGGSYRIVKADPEGWIEWQGGECPLPESARVEVRHEDGDQLMACAGKGAAAGWSHDGVDGDIIAYRPVLDTDDTKPEPPAWDGEGRPPIGVPIESKHKDATLEWANPDFHETTIVAMGKHLAIFTHPGSDHETVGRIDDYDFRPIRSEEDRAIEEMRCVIDVCDAQSVDGRLSALYRAIRDGRVPGVKLEDS